MAKPKPIPEELQQLMYLAYETDDVRLLADYLQAPATGDKSLVYFDQIEEFLTTVTTSITGPDDPRWNILRGLSGIAVDLPDLARAGHGPNRISFAKEHIAFHLARTTMFTQRWHLLQKDEDLHLKEGALLQAVVRTLQDNQLVLPLSGDEPRLNDPKAMADALLRLGLPGEYATTTDLEVLPEATVVELMHQSSPILEYVRAHPEQSIRRLVALSATQPVLAKELLSKHAKSGHAPMLNDWTHYRPSNMPLEHLTVAFVLWKQTLGEFPTKNQPRSAIWNKAIDHAQQVLTQTQGIQRSVDLAPQTMEIESGLDIL